MVDHGQGRDVFLIISEDNEPYAGPVRARVMGSIHRKRQNERHVLVITTETFRNILPLIEGRYKANYDVYLDEGIDPIDQVSFSTERQEVYLDPIRINEDDSFSIAPGSRDFLETVANNSRQLAVLGREELSVPNYIKLAKLLISDIYDVYGKVHKKEIQVIAFLKPDHFLTFRSVTIIMAIFEQSLLALFWRDKYKIDFREYETDHEMFNTHQAKGPSMRIHYLLHPDDNASNMNLKRHWETGVKNENPHGGNRVVDQAARVIEQRFGVGHRDYCWNANTYFSNQGTVLSGVKMPPKCAGLDTFKLLDVVVSLACINPKPWVKDMVIEHIEIADDELYKLWKLSHTYQTIGRCSIRDRDSDRWVDVVVISHSCAEQINALFIGSEIMGQLTELPSYAALRTRRGPARVQTPYDGSDNAAWYRFRRIHPEGDITKDQWYAEIRRPKIIRKQEMA